LSRPADLGSIAAQHLYFGPTHSHYGSQADDTAGVTPRMMQDGAGHADLATQEIYRRGKQRNANKVVQLRQAACVVKK